MTRRLLGTLLVALALALPLVPAGAQDTLPDTPPPPASLSIHDLQAVLVEGGTQPVEATLAISAGDVDRRDLRLVTTLFTRVQNRTELREALASRAPVQAVYASVSTELPDLPAHQLRLDHVVAQVDELSLAGDDLAGVYPLEFRLFAGGEPVGAVLTALVLRPMSGPAPLRTSTLLRVTSTAPPMRSDVAGPQLDALVQADSSLLAMSREIDALLEDGRAAGVVLAASGRLLQDLAEMADGYERAGGAPAAVAAGTRPTRRAAAIHERLVRLARRPDVEVVAYPYGPADLVALVRGGLASDGLRVLEQGVEAVGHELGTQVNGGFLLPPDGLDPVTLAALGPAAAEAVVLDEDYLAFARDDALEPVRRLRTADGGEVRILMPDASLSSLLADDGTSGRAAAVQQFLAETAVQWLAGLEAGGAGGRHSASGVLLATDPTVPLADGMLQDLAHAIGEAPWLRPVSLTEMAARVRPSERLVRLAYPARSAAAELDPEYIARLGEAEAALSPLSALLPAEDEGPSRLEDSLRVAAAIAYRDPANRAEGEARVDEVLTALSGLTGSVSVLEAAPITLTAATGILPVTVINEADVPINVRVRVASTRFAFDQGDQQDLTLLPHGFQTITFNARALNPGGYAGVGVSVEDPSGSRVLATAILAVRSTAFPVVAIIALLGAVIVFLSWGVNQARRIRRPGRHQSVAGATGAGNNGRSNDARRASGMS